MTLVATAMTKGTMNSEDLRGFSIKMTEARFFYNDEIAGFLEEMQQQALDLQICHKMMKEVPREKVELPKRSKKEAYDDLASIANRRFVAEKY